MDDRAEILIVGGGIIGTSLAYSLAERGASGVTVVDLDLAGVYAASELNAGGARATWWQRVNIEACRATLDFFADHAEEFGFHRRGYLWLYGDADLHAQALEKRSLQRADVEASSVMIVSRRRQAGLDDQCRKLARVDPKGHAEIWLFGPCLHHATDSGKLKGNRKILGRVVRKRLVAYRDLLAALDNDVDRGLLNHLRWLRRIREAPEPQLWDRRIVPAVGHCSPVE